MDKIIAKGLEIEYPEGGVELDSLIINILCQENRIDAIRKYDYIKFYDDQKLRIDSRIPNSILVCIKNQHECIKGKEIEEEGEIDV